MRRVCHACDKSLGSEGSRLPLLAILQAQESEPPLAVALSTTSAEAIVAQGLSQVLGQRVTSTTATGTCTDKTVRARLRYD